MKDLRGYWHIISFERVPEWVAAVINLVVDCAIAIGFVEEDFDCEEAY